MAVKLPLLTLPSKITLDEHVYTDGIPKILYEHHNIDEFQESVQAIQNLKDDCGSVEATWRYFTQLDLFELHFPNADLQFGWTDAFNKQPTTQSSTAFEKASVLFNLGALLFKMAADEESDKKQFNYYQAAAFVFGYIKDNFLHAPAKDLSKEVTSFLVNLSLAQAQEVFTLKAWADQKNLLGKLAAGTSTMYDGLSQEYVPDYLPAEWQHVMKIKGKFYKALANVHRSQQLDETAFGEVVARMQTADTDLKEAAKLCKQFDGKWALISSVKNAYLEAVTQFQTQVAERLRKVLRENDVVYHDTVPTTLQDLASTVAAKPCKVTEVFTQLSKQTLEQIDLFKKVIPLDTLEKESLFSVRKDDYIREFQSKVIDADDMLTSICASLDIPSTLSMAKGNQIIIPESLIQGAATLSEQERFTPTFQQLTDLKNQSQKVEALLRTCETYQNADNYSFMANAQLLQDKQLDPVTYWTPFRADVNKLLKDLEAGQNGDALLSKKWDNISGKVNAIAQSNIEKRLFGTDTNALNLLDDPIACIPDGSETSIKKHMQQLEALKKERVKLVEGLKSSQLQKDSVSNLLLLNKKREEDVMNFELQRYKTEFGATLEGNIKYQQQTLDELTQVLDSVKKSNGYQQLMQASSKQLAALDMYKNALKEYEVVRNNIRNGLNYYTRLAQFAQDLVQQGTQRLSSRQTERQNLLYGSADSMAALMQQKLAQMNVANQRPPQQQSVYGYQPTSLQQPSSLQPLQQPGQPQPHYQQQPFQQGTQQPQYNQQQYQYLQQQQQPPYQWSTAPKRD